jgi:hypothetical protein
VSVPKVSSGIKELT